MKKTRILLAVAAFAPLPLFAQSPPAAGGGLAAPGVAPVSSPAATKLSKVQFEEASLQDVIRYLQAQSKTTGTDPNVDPLNIVISPGVQDMRVPALSLRNVSPTEVLTVATTVLGLSLEPVNGDTGAPVAWLIKNPNAQAGPAAGGIELSQPPATPRTTFLGESSGGTGPQGTAGSLPGDPLPEGSLGVTGVPYAVQIAASPPSATGGGAAPSQSRVFGVASLIGSKTNTSEQDRTVRLERLIHSLEKMAADQSFKEAQIKAYGELDILVVKSPDPAVIALIAEAIDAMKSNTKNDNSAQSREDALRAEMRALEGQLSIIRTERDAQRQTLLDQIELLKAGQKGEDASRPKR
jgi:hypothetical protein